MRFMRQAADGLPITVATTSVSHFNRDMSYEPRVGQLTSRGTMASYSCLLPYWCTQALALPCMSHAVPSVHDSVISSIQGDPGVQLHNQPAYLIHWSDQLALHAPIL